MKGHLLFGIRFHVFWLRQLSGRLIKVKYTGNSFGGGDLKVVVHSKWSFENKWSFVQV